MGTKAVRVYVWGFGMTTLPLKYRRRRGMREIRGVALVYLRV